MNDEWNQEDNWTEKMGLTAPLPDADDFFRMLSMLEREERPMKHRFPSGDEIAANYGLTPLRLRRMEKRVKVIYKDNPATIWLAGIVGFLSGVVLAVVLLV